MNKIWIFDTEADGLKATKLHVFSISSPDGKIKASTDDYDKIRKFFSEAEIVIGHNITRWDVPTLERILGIKIKCKLVDTLGLSWALYPLRPKHGLESWGETFGVQKPEITDWHGLTYDQYEHRCSTDVEINRLLWNDIYSYLFELYGSDKKLWKYIEYIQFKMHCARLQEESGWHVDIKRANGALKDLLQEKFKKVSELEAAMPPVVKYETKEKPKKFFKKDGSFSSRALDWFKILADNGLPADEEGPLQVISHVEPPNPNSHTQIKEWLFSIGWVPETYKQVKNKNTGEIRDVPQTTLDIQKGGGICPSIKRLFPIEPRLEVLEGLSIINHRIGVLNGIVDSCEMGKTMAQVKGLTNTLRFQHTTVVNLPKPDRPYAADIRGSLISPVGYVLCGSDMSSLEDRIKQHFIFKYDPDYVHSMNLPDFDPHLTVAGLAGMLTDEDIQEYKLGDKTKKRVRDIAKNGNYA